MAMSHIVSFRIEGLAGRDKPLEMDLNRDTNIFFGQNGSGKTSLLKILHSAMANETEILSGVPFKSAEVSIFSLNYNKVFTRSIEKKAIRKNSSSRISKSKKQPSFIENEMVIIREQLLQKNMSWSCSDKEGADTRWAHQFLPTSRIHVSDEMSFLSQDNPRGSRPWLTEENLDSLFAKSVEILWSKYSAEMLGVVRAAQEQGLASILRAVLSPQSVRNSCGKNILTANAAYDLVKSFLDRQSTASILAGR